MIEVKAGNYAEKVTLSDVPVVLLGELGAQAGPAAILGRQDWDDTSLDIYSTSVVDGFEIEEKGSVPRLIAFCQLDSSVYRVLAPFWQRLAYALCACPSGLQNDG